MTNNVPEQWIQIEGEPNDCDSAVYPVDTLEEIAEARQALRESGLKSAPIFVGDPDSSDAYKTSQILFAGEAYEDTDALAKALVAQIDADGAEQVH